MVLTRTHGIDKDLWYRQGLMILTTPMVLTKTHGIESVLLNHTRMRWPSVTRMRDLFYLDLRSLYSINCNKFQVHISKWKLWCFENLDEKDDRLNQVMN